MDRNISSLISVSPCFLVVRWGIPRFCELQAMTIEIIVNVPANEETKRLRKTVGIPCLFHDFIVTFLQAKEAS
jgi:hypothetical protein